jgi:hypothetical protein
VLLFALAWIGLFGTHLALLRYYGGAELLREVPLAGLDFDTHVHDTWRVLEGLDGWGRSWVWDPRFLAGYPQGTIFDADNKGWEIWTFVWHRLGVSKGFAFNSFVLVAHLGVAPAVYLAARWLDLGRGAALGAACGGVLVWWFDSWLHWCWFVGMVAYALASWLWILPLALFLRWWKHRGTTRAVGVALLLALCHLVHPYSFFMLVTPFVVTYVAGARTLDRRGHLAVWGIAGFTVLANAWWLVVAIEWWPWITDSSLFGSRSVLAPLFDVLGIYDDPAATGIVATKSALRLIAMGLGAAGCVMWRRRTDSRAAPIGVTLVVLAAIAWFGGATPLAQIQPYRHVAPLAFVALLPAAALVEAAIRERWLHAWPRTARITAVGLACATLAWCMQDVLYFTARSLPTPKPLPNGERVQVSALGHPQPPHYGYGDWHRDDLADWIDARDDGQGRVLVEGWPWGEQLAWKSHAQILGGFLWRNVEHGWANLFRRRPQGIVQRAELERYFIDYAVVRVVVATPRAFAPWWDKTDLLELEAELAPFRIYRVRLATHLLDPPRGTVTAETNRLWIEGTDPATDVLVRYHWLPTLACAPGCRIERTPVVDDPVGFFRIPAPHPADFEIVNTYR